MAIAECPIEARGSKCDTGVVFPTQAALELPLPPGWKLPVVPIRSAVQRYRAGGSPDALRRTVDLYGEELDDALRRRLGEDRAEFDRLVSQLEQVHYRMATTHAQLRWLRRWPEGPAPDRAPIASRLPSGHVVAVPVLLAPLRDLVLDPRQLANGDGRHCRRRGNNRRGKSPAMVALADAGLSTRMLAAEMGVSKTAPLTWLHGRYRAPPDLAQAIERLTGDPDLAREIVTLIRRATGRQDDRARAQREGEGGRRTASAAAAGETRGAPASTDKSATGRRSRNSAGGCRFRSPRRRANAQALAHLAGRFRIRSEFEAHMCSS